MDKFIKTLQTIITFIEPYPYWMKLLFLALIALILLFAIIYKTIYRKRKEEKLKIKKQTGDNNPIIFYRNKVPPQKIQATTISYKKLQNKFYITKISLSSQNVIPNLYLAAHAKTIVDFDVSPQRAGRFMTGHSAKREGYWFINVPNFGGKYLVFIKTKKPEEIKIELDIQ